MADYELGNIQERFADIIWTHEPIGSRELANICEKELGWKRPTTYTVLRKLCEKGLFQNNEGTVSSVVPKDEYYSVKSKQIIEQSYNGSLPSFVAAFVSRKSISEEEVSELQKLIDSFRKEG